MSYIYTIIVTYQSYLVIVIHIGITVEAGSTCPQHHSNPRPPSLGRAPWAAHRWPWARKIGWWVELDVERCKNAVNLGKNQSPNIFIYIHIPYFHGSINMYKLILMVYCCRTVKFGIPAVGIQSWDRNAFGFAQCFSWAPPTQKPKCAGCNPKPWPWKRGNSDRSLRIFFQVDRFLCKKKHMKNRSCPRRPPKLPMC